MAKQRKSRLTWPFIKSSAFANIGQNSAKTSLLSLSFLSALHEIHHRITFFNVLTFEGSQMI